MRKRSSRGRGLITRSVMATTKRKRPVRPLPQASSSPARHRPGARFARWERCLAILMQTEGSTSMKSHFSAVLASTPLAVLDQVSWKRFRAIPLNLARSFHVHLLVIIAAGMAQFALTPAVAAGDRAAITIGTEKPLGPALGTFATFGAFSDSGILVTESRVVSALPSPFGLVSRFVLKLEGALGSCTI